MLTVIGGKPCIAALKILLSSPHILIDCQNRRGQTALHLAASFADQTCTELLVRGGACVSVRDKLGLVPADVVPGGIKDSQKKFILGIMKKQKISKYKFVCKKMKLINLLVYHTFGFLFKGRGTKSLQLFNIHLEIRML